MTPILLPSSFCVGCQKWPEETPRTLSLQNLSRLEDGVGALGPCPETCAVPQSTGCVPETLEHRLFSVGSQLGGGDACEQSEV